MRYEEWIQEVTFGASHRDIADKLGDRTHPTVGRSIKARDPKFTVTIAHAYGANAVEGLIAAGFITRDEVTEYVTRVGIGLEAFSDLDLARAIVERLEDSSDHDAFEMTEFPYAADASDVEPEPGDEGFSDGA